MQNFVKCNFTLPWTSCWFLSSPSEDMDIFKIDKLDKSGGGGWIFKTNLCSLYFQLSIFAKRIVLAKFATRTDLAYLYRGRMENRVTRIADPIFRKRCFFTHVVDTGYRPVDFVQQKGRHRIPSGHRKSHLHYIGT